MQWAFSVSTTELRRADFGASTSVGHYVALFKPDPLIGHHLLEWSESFVPAYPLAGQYCLQFVLFMVLLMEKWLKCINCSLACGPHGQETQRALLLGVPALNDSIQ